MKLSLIIINRNNSHLLKQTLNSLANACYNIDYELIIVDNASNDQSLKVLEQDYPFANVIANNTGESIAKANNQALQIALGEYVLMVEPATSFPTESVNRMLDFMDRHMEAGGLSLRMLTSQGRFIAESLHGLTPAWAAFIKFIGFAKNLPKTRLFDKNRKDWVEEFRVTEIDILNDACMLVRRSVLNQTGYFDERFTMFGYNIDLSYRMRLAGYKNYYYPKACIIRLTSNPLSKLNWQNIKYYYGAMFTFAFKYLVRLPELKLPGRRQQVSSVYEVE